MTTSRLLLPVAALAGTFLRQTLQEIKGSRGTYCIGLAACLLVVVVAAVVQTVLEQAPLIFLREAEASVGPVDLLLEPSDASLASLSAAAVPTHINYTRVAESLAAIQGAGAGASASSSTSSSTFDLHAPRLAFRFGRAYSVARDCDATAATTTMGGAAASPPSPSAWLYTTPAGKPCGSLRQYSVRSCLPVRCRRQSTPATILLVDMAKELRAGMLRRSAWAEGQAVPRGSALLPKALADRLGVGVGADVAFTMSGGSPLRVALRPPRAAETGWDDLAGFYDEVAVVVRVHAILPTMQGLAGPDDPGDATAVMEYADFLAHVAGSLHPTLDAARRAPTTTTTTMMTPGGAASPAGPLTPAPVSPDALYAFADVVRVNLAGSARIRAYGNANFDLVRGSVAGFASSVLFAAGFPDLDPTLPLISALEPRRFVTLYLGMLLDVLLLVLFALSTVLIYSLLLINVSGRTFELAVRRMLGSGRGLIVALLLVQAASFGFPAWVLGLVLAQLITSAALGSFAASSGLPIAAGLSAKAVLLATVLATLIPAVASIGPIRAALGPTIRDALDTTRPKVALVKHTVTRSDDSAVPWPVFVGGVALFGFGFAVYFFLPLSLISLNLGLLASLFVCVLVALLGGLVTLALSVDLLLARVALFLCAGWWERAAILRLVSGNLLAHRARNRKTVLMYALSLAFVVLVTVAAEQQVKGAGYRRQQQNGAPLVVRPPTTTTTDDDGRLDPLAVAALEAVVGRYAVDGVPGAAGTATSGGGSGSGSGWTLGALLSGGSAGRFVESFGWASVPLDEAVDTVLAGGMALPSSADIVPAAASNVTLTSLSAKSVGKTKGWYISPAAVSPSVYGGLTGMIPAQDGDGTAAGTLLAATFASLNIPGSEVPTTRQSALSLSEQLYTARGSQAAVVSSFYTIELGTRLGRHLVLESATTTAATNGGGSAVAASGPSPSSLHYARSRIRASAMMDHSSFFRFSRAPRSGLGAALLSFPSLVREVDAHAGLEGVQTVDAAVWQGLDSATQARNGTAASVAAARFLASLRNASGVGVAPSSSSLSSFSSSRVSVEDVAPAALFLSFPDTTPQASVDTLFADLEDALARAVVARYQGADAAARPGAFVPGPDGAPRLGGWAVVDARKTDASVAGTVALLNLVFAVLALVTMVLCFFSLLASVVASVAEQRTELGILRAVGVRSADLLRVLALEALALVLSACASGASVGGVVAFAWGKQAELFTSVPSPFVFPVGVVVAVGISSVVAAWLAAWLPTRALLRKPVTALLRG
jgi:hypothetical protein